MVTNLASFADVSAPRDVLLNLVAALMGFLISQFWRVARLRLSFRGLRGFWGVYAGKCGVVVFGRLEAQLLLPSSGLVQMLDDVIIEGRHEEAAARLAAYLVQQENSGLIGVADLEAYAYIIARLDEINLSSPSSYALSRPTGAIDSTTNLVLIGGEDVNPETKAWMDRLRCTYRNTIVGEKNSISDSRYEQLVPHRESLDGASGGSQVIDYGVIVWAPEERSGEGRPSVLILAGAQGLGTLAAAKATFGQQHELLRRQRTYRYGFECVVRCVREFSATEALMSEKVDVFWPKALPPS